jgi:serine/threonine-protein kinase RsbW
MGFERDKFVIRTAMLSNGTSPPTLDEAGAAALRGPLLAQVSAGGGLLVVNLREVGFVCAAGLATLIAAALRAVALGRPFRLENLPDSLLHRIREIGLEDLLGLEALDSSPSLSFRPSFNRFLSAARIRLPYRIGGGQPLELPGSPDAAGILREIAQEMAREMGFDDLTIGDIELCIGEATINAIFHGRSRLGGGRLTARFFRGKRAFLAEISDQGPGFSPGSVREASPSDFQENGRGLFLMRSLMDFVGFVPGEGTTVQLAKRLSPRPYEFEKESAGSRSPAQGKSEFPPDAREALD